MWLFVDSGGQFFWSCDFYSIVQLLSVFGLLVMFFDGFLAEWLQRTYLLHLTLAKSRLLFDGHKLLLGSYYWCLLYGLLLLDGRWRFVVIYFYFLRNIVVWLDLDLLLFRWKLVR